MRNVRQDPDQISPTQEQLEKLRNTQVPLNTRLQEFLRNIASMSSIRTEDCWAVVKMIDFLLSFDEPEVNELRYKALDFLSKRSGMIKMPQAKHLLYCIGIKYAHRFNERKALQVSLFSLITSSLKANDTILAVIMGDIAKLRNLPLDYPAKLTLPPLILFATANNQVGVIPFLSARGQPIHHSQLGFNPLTHAAARGMNDLIPTLLTYYGSLFADVYLGFDCKFIPEDEYWLNQTVGHRLDMGLSPIAVASAYGHLETVKLLLLDQNDVLLRTIHAKAMGLSIFYAARERHFDIVEYLLDHLKPEKGDFYSSELTLREAIKGNKEELIQRLLKLEVPLTEAVRYEAIDQDHLEIFQKSIQGNFLEVAKVRDFCWAIYSNSRNILGYFLEQIPPEKWNSLLHRAISPMKVTDKDKIKLALTFLKEKGVDLNLRGEKDNTVLMSKLISGDFKFVGLLCELEADPSLRNDEGFNAFDICPDVNFARHLYPLNSNSSPPFSLKQLQHFFMKAQSDGDLESIQKFLLKILQNELALFMRINNSEEGLSPNPSFLKKILTEANELIRSFKQVQFTGQKEINFQIQEILGTFSFLFLFQKLKLVIMQTQNAEAEVFHDARGQISSYLLELASLDPLWLSSVLPDLFAFIIETKAKTAYQFVLSYILTLKKSELKTNLCQSIAEILYCLQFEGSESWGNTKCQAYIFYREAASEIEDARWPAISTLAELLGIEISTTAELEELKELAGAQRFEEVMSRVAKEEGALTDSRQSKSNDQLLICAARNGNLKMIEQLFAKGGFNFNNITEVFFQSIDTAINAGRLNCAAYFVCNMARQIIEQKLYRGADLAAIQRLLPYVTRKVIPVEQADNKAFDQLYNALREKEILNRTLGMVFLFCPNQFQNNISRLNPLQFSAFILKNIKFLEKYIGESIGSIINADMRIVQSYIAAMIYLANFKNQAQALRSDETLLLLRQSNGTRESIINIFIAALSHAAQAHSRGKQVHCSLAILLNEYLQEESLRDGQRLFLFNGILEAEFNSLDEMIVNKPLKILLANLGVQASAMQLFGNIDIAELYNQLLSQGKADDLPSGEFLDLYALVKKKLQEFSSQNVSYGFTLFSEIDSKCLVQIIKLQQVQLENNQQAEESVQKRPKSELPKLSRSGSPALFAPVKEEDNPKEIDSNRKRAPETELESDVAKQMKMDGL